MKIKSLQSNSIINVCSADLLACQLKLLPSLLLPPWLSLGPVRQFEINALDLSVFEGTLILLFWLVHYNQPNLIFNCVVFVWFLRNDTLKQETALLPI